MERADPAVIRSRFLRLFAKIIAPYIQEFVFQQRP
jgi:hypothetical protein